MKVIMVPVSNRPESRVALKVSADLAKRLAANIVACHLRPHRDVTKGYKPKGLPLFGSANPAWLEELDAKSSKSAAHQTKKMFREVSEAADLRVVKRPLLDASETALWQERVGSPDRLMDILGPVADMLVVTRPTAKKNVARMFLYAALLHSGRPVLILPPKTARAPGKRIAIGWNQSAEVARVVAACMPLIQSAEQVTIICCGPEGHPGPKSSQLKSYLRYWGVDSRILISRGHNEEQELMDAYHESGSDLLLMSAYSRSRLREVVFGGMTEFMLSRARIPVIMQHS